MASQTTQMAEAVVGDRSTSSQTLNEIKPWLWGVSVLGLGGMIVTIFIVWRLSYPIQKPIYERKRNGSK